MNRSTSITIVDHERIQIEDLQDRLTVTVEEAGHLLGLGRGAAYAAVRRGDIPSVRVGRRVLVPVRPLLAMFGVQEADQ